MTWRLRPMGAPVHRPGSVHLAWFDPKAGRTEWTEKFTAGVDKLGSSKEL